MKTAGSLPDARDLARRWVARARKDPGWWAHTVFGVTLWDRQCEMLVSWVDNRETSAGTCNGTGKTTAVGVGVIWAPSLWPGTSVLTTATTFSQVSRSIWFEVGQLVPRAKIPLGGEFLQTELRFPQHGSRAFGITAPPNDVQKMQGYRGKLRTLIAADEAGGLSSAILEGVNSMLTGEDTHLLLTGNTIDPMTEFKRTFDRPGVAKIRVSAFETPNFRAFGITPDDIRAPDWHEPGASWRRKRRGRPYPFPALITPEWVRALWEKCGGNEQDPRWLSRVLAQFPKSNKMGLVPNEWFQAAVALGKKMREEGAATTLPTTPAEVGTDVAYGQDGDFSVVAQRRGIFARIRWMMQGADTKVVAGKTAEVMREIGATSAKVDSIGVGAGVVDEGRASGLEFVGVNVGAGARTPEKFVNVRAEEYMALRERFEATYRASMGEAVAPGIAIEEEDEFLEEELATTRWFETAPGKTQIEAKDDIKKRLSDHRSPDRMEALMLAFATGRQAFYFL